MDTDLLGPPTRIKTPRMGARGLGPQPSNAQQDNTSLLAPNLTYFLNGTEFCIPSTGNPEWDMDIWFLAYLKTHPHVLQHVEVTATQQVLASVPVGHGLKPWLQAPS
ncbi:hypothetical protein DACRYDRAFT_107831 [Dacryopinax primogenitus]|uniref:Uncharacterized protein n=1 Tax=Dacryopinax primogenitus (strain DJM 731) TaxID=1858805 RepID=M5FXQ4_DACPD|nr:uncharacterized protein DACRYDRAFT_107831 [Dacryopinax primogenitus]EJU01274.1 hypothetical protein DACRYDRAFT_107831 [Dacryopinax primogenitus]